MSLEQKIFESFVKRINFLFEGKIELIVQQQGDKIMAALSRDTFARNNLKDADAKDVVETLADIIDPTPNNKYLQWIVNRYVSGDFRLEDYHRVSNALTQFEQKRRGLEKKDINQYKRLSDLEDATQGTEEVKSKRQQRQEIKTEGAEVVAKGADGTLVKLKTQEAACYYGKGTKWCTAADNDNMFSHYNKRGPLHVFLGNDGRKYQFHLALGEYMDEKDNSVSVDELTKKYPTLDKFFRERVSNTKKEIFKRYNNPPTDSDLYNMILDFHRSGITMRVQELESYILNIEQEKRRHRIIGTYIKKLEERWPEGEEEIVKMANSMLQRMNTSIADAITAYVFNNHSQRWPDIEPFMLTNPIKANKYKQKIVKDDAWASDYFSQQLAKLDPADFTWYNMTKKTLATIAGLPQEKGIETLFSIYKKDGYPDQRSQQWHLKQTLPRSTLRAAGLKYKQWIVNRLGKEVKKQSKDFEFMSGLVVDYKTLDYVDLPQEYEKRFDQYVLYVRSETAYW